MMHTIAMNDNDERREMDRTPGAAGALQVLREVLQELEPRLTHFRLLQQDVEAELKEGRKLRDSELRYALVRSARLLWLADDDEEPWTDALPRDRFDLLVRTARRAIMEMRATLGARQSA